MVSPRMRCLCCALPQRLLDYVAAQAEPVHRGRISQHKLQSAQIRSARRIPDVTWNTLRMKQPAGQRRRFIYDARGTDLLPGTLARTEGDAVSRDAVVNHAYRNLGITLEFFRSVFGLDSLDGRGMDVLASVHYGDDFSNAMWTGEQILFGDGDGIHILGFAQSLDIVAHELTHAVTQHAIRGGLGETRRGSKVKLLGQAGALNESFSDIFASLIKQWRRKQDVKQASWLVGEGILAPHIGNAVRSLKKPGDARSTYPGDDQVRHMRDFVDDGEVHTMSGIPNYAFYLAASAMGGRAWERAGRIWYTALPRLGSKATFTDAARATEQSASDLFGPTSKEARSVSKAWQKVGVVGQSRPS
jgi:Zn-dependent metalloprotease